MDYAFYMKMALNLARKGVGRTSPNPCVGAVVVRDNQVVGRGWHRRTGTPHAEVHALEEAGTLARGATIVVTLEPCHHQGRTPPCSRAILAAGIKRLVYGMGDPTPLAGGGACFLAEKGVEVIGGVLEEQCRRLNRPFISRVTRGKPWVLLKAATSLDGRIATAAGLSKWITGEHSRKAVHRIRNRCDAIMVGVGTVLADDPSLTTRLPGARGRDPRRIILDTTLRTPPTARVLGLPSSLPTTIYCGPAAREERVRELAALGADIRRAGLNGHGSLDLTEVLADLGALGVNELLVEGGGQVHGAFLRAELADELALFIAPLILGADGVAAVGPLGLNELVSAPRLQEVVRRRHGEDLMVRGLIKKL